MSTLEKVVMASSFFDKLCTKIFDTLDFEAKGMVPILKLTLAVPVLFQRFQSKLFDRFGENLAMND